jgi:hypothetical protein
VKGYWLISIAFLKKAILKSWAYKPRVKGEMGKAYKTLIFFLKRATHIF